MVRRTRPQVYNCTPGNLEIPGLVLAHHPGMTLSLRPDRVRRALDEGLQLRDILFLQLAGEVGHAAIAERALEHDVLQVGDGFGRDIAEVPDIAAVVDAGHAVAGGAGGDIDGGAFLDILRIVLHALEQPLGLILYEGRQWFLAIDREGVDRAGALQLGGANPLADHTAPTDRDRDILLAVEHVGRGRRHHAGTGR